MTDAEWAVHHVRVMVGDPETWRLNDEDVRALVLMLDELDRLALRTTPEREVVGWRVAISIGNAHAYAFDSEMDPEFGWLETTGRPKPMPRVRALNLLDRCEQWNKARDAGWTFRLIRITRRKAEVGR
jgi:hypothetical protein